MKRVLACSFIGVVVVCALAVAFAQHSDHTGRTGAESSKPEVIGAIKSARVRFVFPADGATVPQTFKAKFEVEGLKIAKAGTMEPGTGHFHIIIDKPAVKEGEPIPFDDNHLHFGNGDTEAELKLSPGKHTLTLQFADGAHRAYGGNLVQTITVTVK